jgi:uncharacterized peroxidase-related enzyme
MWIHTIPYANSTGQLKAIYERVAGPGGTVDNILEAHSLRPHTLRGHMALYKSVLHHTGNEIPVWFLETIGVHVSLLNRCWYCVDHHLAGLQRLVGADRAADIKVALESGTLGSSFSQAEVAALVYAAALTSSPGSIDEGLVRDMRAAGLSDGEILEINQVAAYFAYANRVVNGLGVTTEGDELGLSPENSADTGDWRHG